MTATSDRTGAQSPRNVGTANSGDDYGVHPMFARLATMPEGSSAYLRQRDDIVTRCLPLATNIAHRYNRRGEPLDDLVQVARIGLLNAVNRFDLKSGSSFLGFAVPTILGEVRRHFRDHGWAVKVPRRFKDMNNLLTKGTAELTGRLGRTPNASELAEHLGLPREQVIEGLTAASAYSTLSTDAAVGDGDRGEVPAFVDTLGAVDASFDKVLDTQTLRPLLAALPERERTVLFLRFFDELTQSQIGERLGISQMHVSRLLSSTLAALRDHAVSGGDDAQIA